MSQGSTGLRPMSAQDQAAWRESRSLPDVEPDEQGEALELVVDGVRVGGVLLARRGDDVRVQQLQATLPASSAPEWSALVTALKEHVRGAGGRVLRASLPPSLAQVFLQAGWQVSMVGHLKRLSAEPHPSLQQDRRVSVRAMTRVELEDFVRDSLETVREGLARSGAPGSSETGAAPVERRLTALLDHVPDEELLLAGVVDETVVGRVWGTFAPAADGSGATVFQGHLVDILPAHRGQRLARSLAGAVSREVHARGVRDVTMRTYGYDRSSRSTYVGAGVGVAEVHLRTELA